MIIALDYDNTFTADNSLWKGFIHLALWNNHKIYIVTMRNKELDWHPDFDYLKEQYNIETIFCDGESKRKITKEYGLEVDIWIDDYPEGISEGTQYTPVELTEWRKKAKENGEILDRT